MKSLLIYEITLIHWDFDNMDSKRRKTKHVHSCILIGDDVKCFSTTDSVVFKYLPTTGCEIWRGFQWMEFTVSQGS